MKSSKSRTSYVLLFGTVIKTLAKEPPTEKFPRARTVALLQLNPKTEVRVTAYDAVGAKHAQGARVQVEGVLHAYRGGLEVRAFNVELATQGPLIPDFTEDAATVAAVEATETAERAERAERHSAAAVLAGKPQDKTESPGASQ